MDHTFSPEETGHLIEHKIRDILGSSAGSVFFQVLEERFSVTTENLANRPEIIANALKSFFGPGGETIERSIVVALAERHGVSASSHRLESFVRTYGG